MSEWCITRFVFLAIPINRGFFIGVNSVGVSAEALIRGSVSVVDPKNP